jgi:membrane protease YdiL (CAAX protease family)
MNAAIELGPIRTQGWLPLAAGFSLLMMRLVVLGRGEWTIPLLVIIYASVLAVSRTAPGINASRQVAFPLLAGIAAVVLVRLFFATPFPVRSTIGGIVLSVLAGVAEERLFRGALFGRLLPYGTPVAIVASAALFALMHVPFYGVAALPIDFGAGLLFAWQRSESGYWFVPAATHSLANLLAVLP